MIGRLEQLLRRLRRLVSRSEWAIRLLGLSVSRKPATERGLVMIQIDGLSHGQLTEALERGEMPFLKRLLTRERYRLHVHYAGIPSSTPRVQGELFYGVARAVPAFSFRDGTGEVVRMFDPAPAGRMEADLAARGEPLLAGGSAYADIFTGGADESHFCPSALGWGSVLAAARPVTLAVLIASNLYSFVRAAVLVAVEVPIALVDVVRGLIDGRSLGKELKFVLTRVAICILLRELVTIGAKVDVARGLPVVHLNFLGYDEQAHRRGPSSHFAHWALKGIDDAVARVWRAAHRSARRDYDVWIYADHGQEETLPYPQAHGRTIQEAVAAAFRAAGEAVRPSGGEALGVQLQRFRLLGGRDGRLKGRLTPPAPEDGAGKATGEGPADLTVAAMGPVGLVYYDRPLGPERRARVAKALVSDAGVPIVLVPEDGDAATAFTPAGTWRLPDEASQVLGADHPFLAEAGRDLAALAHHAYAGAFVLIGWRRDGKPYSFPVENGSHAGPGPEETRAFALLPDDAPIDARAARVRPYLRTADLRAAARRVLAQRTPAGPEGREAQRDTVRVMTYNVHSCIGMDGKHAPERIARVIARHRPDVVALQELDVGRLRTGGVDQAHLIAEYLEMAFHFHPAIHVEEERYGDAVLTHLPMRVVRADALPSLKGGRLAEPRGAIWTAIEVDGVELQLLNTHFGLREKERRLQVEALMGPDWVGHPDCRAPVVLCGDFNARPASPVCTRIRRRLHDAQMELAGHRPLHTAPGRYPVARIDHLFVDPSVEVVDIQVPASELEQVASDHLPLIVELRLPRPAEGAGRHTPADAFAAPGRAEPL
jgi:endonuclease/exonuclease/phosphatase family metal-dependent hydrolase